MVTIKSVFRRHERAALMLSGGKDSLAVFELVRNAGFLDRTAVVWVDTGAQLPEIHALMDAIKLQTPYFFVCHTDQPGQTAAHGAPVDILPVWNSVLGQAIGGDKPTKLQSWLDCCGANIWYPSYEFVKGLNVTALLRGQRNSEQFKAPTRSGQIYDGIELIYPIEDWTRDETLAYLAQQGYQIDDRLQLGHSSLDCWSCTAFASATPDRLAYLGKRHPEKAQKVFAALEEIRVVIQNELGALTRTLETVNG